MMIFLYLVVSIALILFCLVFALLVFAQFLADLTTDTPFVSVPKKVESEIIKNLNLNQNSILFDLGCGNAHMLARAAREYPQIKAVGIELAFWPFVLAKIRTRKYKNITIKHENIFKSDITSATHIFLYLYPKVVSELIKNIKLQCKTGTIILSCDFEIENMTPVKIIDLESVNPFSVRGKKLFVYTI